MNAEALIDIRRRDAEAVRCATCHMHDDAIGHTETLAECEARLVEECTAAGKPVRGCREPQEHHDFVPGEVDPYPFDGAGEDRHALIGMVDELVGALHLALDVLPGDRAPVHYLTARAHAESVLAKFDVQSAAPVA